MIECVYVVQFSLKFSDPSVSVRLCASVYERRGIGLRLRDKNLKRNLSIEQKNENRGEHRSEKQKYALSRDFQNLDRSVLMEFFPEARQRNLLTAK